MEEISRPRRAFLRNLLLGLLSAAFTPRAWGGHFIGRIPVRVLGNSSQIISILGLAGYRIGQIVDDREAVELVREAMSMGVNFISLAWDLDEGRSVELVARAIQKVPRGEVIVATGTSGRDMIAAGNQLDKHLKKLGGYVDVWMFHESAYKENPDWILNKQGAIKAGLDAQAAGHIRWFGFTGNRDENFFKTLLYRFFHWTGVQMPVNAVDPLYSTFTDTVTPWLNERYVGVVAMDPLARGYLDPSKGISRREAFAYVWSQHVSTIVVEMNDADTLRENVHLARTFKTMGRLEQQRLLQKLSQTTSAEEYERYKKEHEFEGWKSGGEG